MWRKRSRCLLLAAAVTVSGRYVDCLLDTGGASPEID